MKRWILWTFLFAGLMPACKQKPGQADAVVDTDVKADYVIKDLEEAISQTPDSVRLYDRLIDTLTNRKQFAAAAQWCNKLIGRGADSNYYYWFVKGDIFRRGEMYDSAIACYQTYLKKFPDDEQVLLNLANTYAEAGNKDAVDIANMIAARFPTREMRTQAAFIKGVYYNTVKQYKDARRWLDTAIIINYNFSEAYMEKGYSFYDEGDFSNAAKTFLNLTKVNSNDADGWYWLAKSQEAMGKKADAISSYQQALALDDTIAEAKKAIEKLSAGTSIKP